MKCIKLFFILWLSISSFTYGGFWVNHTPLAYSQNNSTLESLTVRGAGCFIKANSDFLAFVQKYELNPVDMAGMADSLNSTIENLIGLVQIFSEIKDVSEQSSYNTEVLKKLAIFDYSSTQIVKPYLGMGNITGAFKEILLKAKDLLDRVTLIKNDIEKGIFPNISILWDVNNKFIESMIFGQNIAQVFKSFL